MKRTAKLKEITGGLPVGKHVVEIVEVVHVGSKSEGKPWADETPQLKVVFENEQGKITAWLNKKGFKNKTDFTDGIAPKGFTFMSFDDESEKFLVKASTKQRVESLERTEKLMENIDNLAACCDLDDFDPDTIGEEILGMEVGINVTVNSRGKNEVQYIMPASKVQVEVED